MDHATELAHRSLIDSGWALTSDHDWRLAWTLELPGADTFTAADTGRWVNHIRGIAALTVKSHLCVTLRAGAQRAAAAGASALFGFAPQTYLLPAEWDAWLRARAWDPDAVWIQKPADMSRGRGVALVSSPDEVSNGNLVVQRYITNPHLLDGFKYSLRFYVLVTSVEPLIAYVFEDGFTKLASRPFSLAAADRADRFRHLTNPDVLRDDPRAEGVSSRNTTHRDYRRRLQQDGVDDAALFSRVRRALAATLVAAQPSLKASEQKAGWSGRGQFELIGMDIAIDDRLQPWLLECNLSPSLSVEATAETTAGREEAALKTQVVRETLILVGASDGDQPPVPPVDESGARALLKWHDSRRGGFERLWPSRAALEALTGVDDLGDMDRALLADEASAGGWPDVTVNAVTAIACGDGLLLYDRRRDRVTLLDRDEREAWTALTPGRPLPAALPHSKWDHGVEWLREGLLAPTGTADDDGDDESEPRFALQPRTRQHWNQERVYSRHGLRVAIVSASPRQEAALDQALAWDDAGDAIDVDATIFVPQRTPVADVLAHLDRLALRRLGGVVRRQLTFASKGGAEVLIASGERQARRWFGDGWTIASKRTMIGGAPFGVAVEVEGRLQPLSISGIAGTSASHGDLLLDLVSAGPGVIYAFDAASVRALATWIETIPIWPTTNPES